MKFTQFIGGIVLSSALFLTSMASAVTVLGTAGPYDPTLNPTIDYGIHDNTAPTAIPVNAGDNITIAYISGLTSAFGGAPLGVDANGYVDQPYGSGPGRSGEALGFRFPSYYLDPTNTGTPVNLNQLMGSFVNSAGKVIVAFAI